MDTRTRWPGGAVQRADRAGMELQVGGPAFRPDATFPLGRVAASTDPVAADLWAWKVIDAERRRRGMPTLEASGRPPRFVATAAGYGLGVGTMSDLVEIEG